MYRKVLALAALAPSLLVLGCTEPTVTDPLRPSLSVASGPAEPGSSGVVRFGDPNFVRLDYETEDGVRIVRHYPADDSFEFCDGSQQLPVLEEQYVTDPNFVNGVIVVLRQTGEVPVLIYPPNDADKPLCEYLQDDWLFKGTGQLIYNDNNFFFDPSRTNFFGWRGEGTVYDRDGRRYRYTEQQGTVSDPDPFIEHVTRSALKLVPVR